MLCNKSPPNVILPHEMEGQVYNPPLLPYDDCIFMSSGSVCSPCQCVCKRLCVVLTQVCSSPFLSILRLFSNVLTFLWLQILRYVLIGIIRHVSFQHGRCGNATGRFRSVPPSLFSIWSDNESPDFQYEEMSSFCRCFGCVYSNARVLAYLYVNQRLCMRVFTDT